MADEEEMVSAVSERVWRGARAVDCRGKLEEF